LAFGAIYALSGSLLGAMLAHAVINGLNLAYLKAYDPTPPRHSLGGLLSDRRSPVPSAGAAAAATLPIGERPLLAQEPRQRRHQS
jgi:membrane protease YdiL (CAAX protease family)